MMTAISRLIIIHTLLLTHHLILSFSPCSTTTLGRFMNQGRSKILIKNKYNPRMDASSNNNNNDDMFDPLLSPHAYPNGTNGERGDTKKKKKIDDIETNKDEDWSPFQMSTVKDDFKGATKDQYGVEKSVFTRKWSETINSVHDTKTEESDDDNETKPEFFDPLISPHCYPKGTDAGPVTQPSTSIYTSSSRKSKIGILLVDHGSRREASNVHLEKLAYLYQQRAPSHYVIRAAHMEIAKPSIRDGIQDLIQQEGVDKVVCHPYFLSPGRHVAEDIPQLIEEAIIDLKIGHEEGEYGHIEVLTTSHVGSQMDMMVDMISAMVDDTIGITNTQQSGFVEKDPSSSLGGFFGEIQKMLDEQL